MKHTAPTILLASLFAFGGSLVSSTVTKEALASRNSTGTYSLPAGNPVVSGTTIASSWANATLGDIATETTNSLDRNGRGAMLAPLQLSDGTSGAPSLTFANETSMGFFRNGSHDFRAMVNGANVLEYTATGVSALGLAVGNVVKVGNGASSGPGFSFINEANSGLYRAGSGDIRFALGGTDIAHFTSGGVTIGGSNGTAISTSPAASFTINFGTLSANTCSTSTGHTLSGVASGGVCMVTPTTASTTATFYCYAGTGSVAVYACPVGNSTPTISSQAYAVRVFQP